jgi:hypothetical protein
MYIYFSYANYRHFKFSKNKIETSIKIILGCYSPRHNFTIITVKVLYEFQT